MAERINVFLAWSGEKSHSIANALRDWLPQVINAARPWLSSEDIEKGQGWTRELDQKLNQAKIGILCLTHENPQSPWILYEAGALSRTAGESFVCPYLFDLKPADIPGPLAQFQATLRDRRDTLKLVRTINKSIGSPRTDDQLQKAFEKWWPDLEGSFNRIGAPQIGNETASQFHSRVARETSQNMTPEQRRARARLGGLAKARKARESKPE